MAFAIACPGMKNGWPMHPEDEQALKPAPTGDMLCRKGHRGPRDGKGGRMC